MPTRDSDPVASNAADAEDARDEERADGPFPIVGLGASAGGLEAFTELLGHLPLDTGMAFVLVQHLDPSHTSALTQLLARATSLPVEEISDDLHAKPNHVYVIPPNWDLVIAQGVLKLEPRQQSRTPNRPIDSFFESLAHDQRGSAIGVVLSGTATDGTLGLEAIKAEGGVTFAQDKSARYDSMPRSAVAAGCVDFVMSPENIAIELARIARHPYLAAGAHESPSRFDAEQLAARNPEQGFKKILQLLRSHSGVDFSLYKPSTIRRRVSRRMVLSKHDTTEAFAEFLQGNAKALDALYSDALISVTSFFRNPEAFVVLQRDVLPKLFAQLGEEPLRVWVLGCSTGQEAYSIAMAAVEAGERPPYQRKIQVFATDLNDALLDRARKGLYSKSIADEMTADRLQRFFVEESGGYRVSKALRQMVMFAKQNLVGDPPFSRIDLISCRNLLIYLSARLQKEVFPVFHYALKPDGYLLLGASESIGGFSELFETVDKKHKLYSKKAVPTPAFKLPASRGRREPRVGGISETSRTPIRTISEAADADDTFGATQNAHREADRVTVSRFAPPGVLVDAALQIVQFRGATGAYLEPTTGKASFDVLKMARKGLRVPMLAAITEARQDQTPVRKENLRLEQSGTTVAVNLEVIPLRNLREQCFLILFETSENAGSASPATGLAFRNHRTPTSPPTAGGRAPRGAAARRVAELEIELAAARDYAHSIEEQHEAANEELQAANEEAQSANEELQSINEEMETAQEELESTNEELTTLNEELNRRNVELYRANGDLVNLETSAQLSIVLLGSDLSIRRFSARAGEQFGLLAADVGRSLGSIRHVFDLPDLESLVRDAIDSVHSIEREVRGPNGRWFSLRVNPYLTDDNRVDGAIVELLDIDALKRGQQAIAAARDFAVNTLETVREPLLVLDHQLRVESANRSFYREFVATPDETVGRSLFELANHQLDIPPLHTLAVEILSKGNTLENVRVDFEFEKLGRRTMLLNARRLYDTEEDSGRILMAIEDITERDRLEELRARLAAVVETSYDPIVTINLEGIVTSWNRAAEELFGYSATAAVGEHISIIAPRDRRAEQRTVLARIRRGEKVDQFETERISSAGQRVAVSITSSPLVDAQGNLIGASKIISDIGERRKAEEVQRHFRSLFDAAPGAYAVLSPDKYEFVAVSEAYLRASMTERHTLIGRPFFEVFPDDPANGAADGVRNMIASLERVKKTRRSDVMPVQRYPIRRPDAESGEFEDRWWSPINSPVLGPDGEVIYLIHRAEDVTHYVATHQAGGNLPDAMQALETRAQLMEADIVLRAHELQLANERLRGREAELKEADQRKNEFLAMLAHELRNPLAPIRNALQIINLAGDQNEIVQSASQIMDRQVSQMVRLVDDLLDISRVSRGKIELRKGRIELSSIVYHAVEVCRPHCETMGHDLTVALPPNPIYLNADATRLTQVLGNLLNNACKFTPRGGRIWLTVEGPHETGGDPREVVIRVRDTGVGIASVDLPRIFEMFVQVDASLERAVGGLGMGLTLVKQLMELHDGSVEVRSEGSGRGSEFVLRLPILSDPTTAPSQLTSGESPTVTARRILVVDDNRDSAESLAMLLRMTGNDVRTAHDGMEALETAEAFRPGVVLLDIGLPLMNGHEVARKIRERDWGKPMLLVALTGWGLEDDRRRTDESGFDAHVVKPANIAALTQLISELRPKEA